MSEREIHTGGRETRSLGFRAPWGSRAESCRRGGTGRSSGLARQHLSRISDRRRSPSSSNGSTWGRAGTSCRTARRCRSTYCSRGSTWAGGAGPRLRRKIEARRMRRRQRVASYSPLLWGQVKLARLQRAGTGRRQSSTGRDDTSPVKLEPRQGVLRIGHDRRDSCFRWLIATNKRTVAMARRGATATRLGTRLWKYPLARAERP